MNSKNLSDTVDEVYKKLQKGESVSVSNIEEGKFFIKKFVEDYSKFEQILGANFVSRNSRGWLGNIPLSLTIEIMNREERPGKKVHVNLGYERHLVVYFGICPELECFVNIILWPSAESSNTSHQAYKNIYEMVTSDKEFKNILEFGEGIEIELINSLHPSRCKSIKTILKPKNVYDWQYVPFIKEIGDTILSHISPLNFKHVYLDEVKLKPSHINPKVILGRIISIERSNIEILVPSIFGKWINYHAKVSDKLIGKIDNSYVNSLNYFLIFESLNGNVQDVVERIDPTSPIDLLGHFVSFLLYTLKVFNKRLYTILVNEYEEICKRCFKIVDNFCRIENSNYSGLWDPNNIFQAYLSHYFRIIDNSIYYVPMNQFQVSNEMLLIYDKSLQVGADSLSKVISSKGNLKFTLSEHKTYDFIKLCSELKQYLIWNQERDLLCRRLKNSL